MHQLNQRIALVLLLVSGLAAFDAHRMCFAQEANTSKQQVLVQLAPHPENVVASELLGEWIADKEISDRLAGRSDHAHQGPIEFRQNEASEKRIIKFLSEFVESIDGQEQNRETKLFLQSLRRIYLVGEVEFDGQKQDFALISIFGCPRLILFDRQEDIETENVMLARDESGDNDLLFLGGDFNNQSFGAFRRRASK